MSKTSSRVKQIIIRRSSLDFITYSKLGYKANNIFNLGTYYMRQSFFKNNNLSYTKLNQIFKQLNKSGQNCLYTQVAIHICQQMLRQINKNFKAFFKALKKWKKHPKKFTGRPRIPHYHHKDKPCTFVIDNQDFKFDRNKQLIEFNPNHWKKLTWWKRRLHDIKLGTTNKIKHVGQIVVVPKRYYVKLLISYQVQLPDTIKNNKRYMSIDPGVNNLLCCGLNIKGLRPFIINGRGVKSVNQYSNKEIAQTRRCLMKCNYQYISHYLDFLFTKRHFKLYYLCHEASKDVVDYALNHDISRIIIGAGATRSKQKSNLGTRNNQNFIQIPFKQLIQDIQYKAESIGIKVIITEESYTSQSSFLDNEKPCKQNGNKARKAKRIKHPTRRIKRGLYKSNKGQLINADLNGALQIMKKVYPKAFNADGLEGYVTDPLKINL